MVTLEILDNTSMILHFVGGSFHLYSGLFGSLTHPAVSCNGREKEEVTPVNVLASEKPMVMLLLKAHRASRIANLNKVQLDPRLVPQRSDTV